MKEEFVGSQFYLSEADYDIADASEMIAALEKPAGRFIAPHGVSLWKRKLLAFGEKLLRGFFGPAFHIVIDAHFPPSWKSLFRYFKDRGLIYENYHHPFMPLPNDFPKFCAVFFPCGDSPGNYAGGCAGTAENAFSKAAGELLERQSFLLGSKKKNFLYASFAELSAKGKTCIDPTALSRFSGEQKNKNPNLVFDEHSTFTWVDGKNFITKESVFIPAQTVFWDYFHAMRPKEPLLREPCTNGAGGFFTLEGAILSGLYELIERDAFLIYWLNSLTPQKINPRSISNPEVQHLLRKCDQYRLKIHIAKLVSDIPAPIFAVITENLSETGPLYAVGGSANLNPERAILSALYESLTVYASQTTKARYMLPQNYEPFSDNALSRDERVSLWQNQRMKGKMDFLLNGEEKDFGEMFLGSPTYKNEGEELRCVVSAITKLRSGYDIYYYEAAEEYLKKVGYRVAKVIVPELVHLYLTESLANLENKRIVEVPQKIGLAAPKAMNPYPHPFP
ncbi:MAG: YcaO-like family protein [Candidatus Liptonbacteria bacterium]|nr:YcaO-like family protein [Candidatus Liptonbacteria bacterium]